MAMPLRARDARGFSLIEMMIAMAIAVFVITISTTVHLGSLRSYRAMEDRSSLTQDSLLLIDYLRNQVIGTGGGSMRGWMGIWLENNCDARSVFPACGGSDRVTLTALTIPVQECAITGNITNTPMRLQIAFSSPGVCCLQPQIPSEVSFLNRPVLVGLGDLFRQRFVTAVDLDTCQISLQTGQASGGDIPGPVNQDWTGGMVSLVQVDTLYRDPATNMLKRFVDANSDGVADPGEDQIVADNIFDFQMALGYDFNPADGNVVRTPNGLNDEWLHNAPGANEVIGTAPFLAPMSRAQLHLVSVGVIMGTRERGGSANHEAARLFNGPQRSQAGWILQSEFSTVAPRNSYVFQ